MTSRRILSILLLLSILFSTLTSCGGGQSETEAESLANTESAANADTECGEETIEETETETETEIKDVMIGETLDAPYASDFTVAKIFSDDMVVQRNEHIRVWGFANESENGKKVSGEFKGMFAEALIENGEWTLTFTARLQADTEGAEMKIYTDKKTVTFKNVLVGDVYLIMGQSNAAYSVNDHISYNGDNNGGGKSAIDQNSIIRLNNLNNSGGAYRHKGSAYVYSDLENTKFWTKTTEQDTMTFSALGYYFARHMVEKTDKQVPVGMIEVAKGGAPLGSFLPNELADSFDTDYYSPATDVYLTHRSTEHMGRYLYNCYLAPIQKYAIAGVVWYQGESDNDLAHASAFGERFNAFIEYLRGTHNVINKNFPVFVTELATIYQAPKGFSGTWYHMEVGLIRSFMGQLPSAMKNTYIAASGDVWTDTTYFNNLHPGCKYQQAERLADIAEAVILGQSKLDDAAGPYYKSFALNEDKKTVTVTFTNVGDGLTTSDGGTAVKGIVGFANKDYVLSEAKPVSATISGKDQITVTFDEEVKAVAYFYDTEDSYGDTINLCNSRGIPATAFITAYTDTPIGEYSSDTFVEDTTKKLGKKGKSIDRLNADGTPLFSEGGVLNSLEGAGYKVSIEEGTSIITCFGWIGFRYDMLLFGYSIDDGNAVFKTLPSTAESAVISAAGKLASRFNVNVDVSDLTSGEHTINILVLLNTPDGKVPVKILTFTATVTAKKAAPAGLDIPFADDNGTGFIYQAQDRLEVGSTRICDGHADLKLQSMGNKVTAKKGTATVTYTGWLGFETALESFGYAIDGGTPNLTFKPIEPEPAVKQLGGDLAARYIVTADISSLEVGEHTIDILVKIKTQDGGTSLLKITSFRLVIE